MKELSIFTIPDDVSDEYSVYVGNIDSDKIIKIIETKTPKADKVCIICDDNISSLYFNSLRDELVADNKEDFQGFYFDIAQRLFENSFEVIICTLPHGDENKSLENSQYILSLLEENDFTRDDLIISIGGGMIGDISGFSASIYKRGINVIHLPTTLLSMIDSCIGSKTAINFGNSKNSVGTFYNPCHVAVSPIFLETLPEKELLSGLGEAVKYSIIEKFYMVQSSHEGFDQFEVEDSIFNVIRKLLCKKIAHSDVVNLIYRCLRIKKFFVEKDPFDLSIRKFLNLGHTIGHCIETLSDYEVPHGKAVLMGISHMLKVSLKGNLISENFASRYFDLINTIGISGNFQYSISQICSQICKDKKVSNGEIPLILPCEACGVQEVAISLDDVHEFLSV